MDFMNWKLNFVNLKQLRLLARTLASIIVWESLESIQPNSIADQYAFTRVYDYMMLALIATRIGIFDTAKLACCSK